MLVCAELVKALEQGAGDPEDALAAAAVVAQLEQRVVRLERLTKVCACALGVGALILVAVICRLS